METNYNFEEVLLDDLELKFTSFYQKINQIKNSKNKKKIVIKKKVVSKRKYIKKLKQMKYFIWMHIQTLLKKHDQLKLIYKKYVFIY